MKLQCRLEFPGEIGGAKQKTFNGGSMDVFWNCRLLISYLSLSSNRQSIVVSLSPHI